MGRSVGCASGRCPRPAVEKIRPEDSRSYGVVDVADSNAKLGGVKGIVEKPKPEEAPSDLGVVGRYILTSSIFNQLMQTGRGAGNEIQLTDGIARMLTREPVMAYRFSGKRYDCGSKLGYLEATLDYALRHPELGPGFAEILRERAKSI